MTIAYLYILALLAGSAEHDIHVGVCDIRLNDEKVKVTIKTFIDDLQIAVGLEPGQPLPDDYTSAEDMIGKYISSAMQLKLDGKPLDLRIDDLSSSAGDAVWITLISEIEEPVQESLEGGFELLTDIYDDQTNIINVYHNKSREIYSLDTKKVNFAYVPE